MQLWRYALMRGLLAAAMYRQAASRRSHPLDTIFPITRKGANARSSLLAPRRMTAGMSERGAGLSRSRIATEQGAEINEEPWIASLDEKRSRACEATGLAQLLILIDNRPGLRIQNQSVGVRLVAKVKHVIQRARNRIPRPAANSAQVPVVFDESKNRGLIRYGVIDEVLLGPGRNHQQWQPWTESAAAILRSSTYVVRFWRTAIAWPQHLIVRHIRLGYDGPHLVVVPAVGIIPRDDDCGFFPLFAPHECIDHIDDKDLFVDRIRVCGMAILIRSRF